MQEDRAPAPALHRRVVPAEHRDHVVDRILAPQGFVPCRVRQADGLVVVAVGGVVAPGVLGRDGFAGQRGGRARAAVGAPQHAAQRQQAGGVAPSPSLVGADAALPMAQRSVSPRKRSRPSAVTRAVVVMGRGALRARPRAAGRAITAAGYARTAPPSCEGSRHSRRSGRRHAPRGPGPRSRRQRAVDLVGVVGQQAHALHAHRAQHGGGDQEVALIRAIAQRAIGIERIEPASCSV